MVFRWLTWQWFAFALFLFEVSYASCNCTISLVSSSTTYFGSISPGDGGTYTATTTDPLGLWSGESLNFRGVDNGGNITVFDFHIKCSMPCWLKGISIGGVAWGNANTLTLYNKDKSLILGTETLSGGNTFQSFVINTTDNEYYFTEFRLIETNRICCWRYRSFIDIFDQTVGPATVSPTKEITPSPTRSPVPLISDHNDCDCIISCISSSNQYNLGDSIGGFISSTLDPLGPWNGESIHLLGIDNGGNHTVFDYEINCNRKCWIKYITVQGVAWGGSNHLTLYNENKTIILGEITVNGGNTFQSHQINMTSNEYYLRKFRFVETNNICCWRYRSLISLDMFPEPTTAPTTDIPTTSIPTTSIPTTSIPTTSKPSTFVPTTHNPSTFIPSISISEFSTENQSETTSIQTTDSNDLVGIESGERITDNSNFMGDSLYYIIGSIVGFLIICCVFVFIVVQRNKKNKQQINKQGTSVVISQMNDVISVTDDNEVVGVNAAASNTDDIDLNDHEDVINTHQSFGEHHNGEQQISSNKYQHPSSQSTGSVFSDNDVIQDIIVTTKGNDCHSNDLDINDNRIITPGNDQCKNNPNIQNDEFVISGEGEGYEIQYNAYGNHITKQ